MNDATILGRADALRRIKPYPAYKNPDVEWLGHVPAHWNVKPLKRVATLHTGATPPGVSDDAFNDDGVPWVKPDHLLGDNGILDVAQKLERGAAEAIGIVRKGSALVCGIGTVGKTGYAPTDVCTNQQINAITFGAEIDDRFGQFLVSCLESEFVRLSNKVTIPICNKGTMAEVLVCVPAETEQRAIAKFLDDEAAKIDALVAKKERVIELLQEKRTALIMRAVTKGLDPTVPMKDSGVEWLGQIPVHWEVKRTKFAARLRSGHTPSRQHPEYWQNCTIPWFGLADVWQIRDGQTEYMSETAEKISELGLANSAARLLPRGTVMLSRTASVGFSAIMAVDMATTQDFVNWVCGSKLQSEFLLYVFRSMQHEFRRLTMGSTHQTIYMPDVGRFSTPVPPTTEQDQIVSFIRKESARIDSLIAKIRDAIDRLTEFRTALISAAVTGKIDVREEAA